MLANYPHAGQFKRNLAKQPTANRFNDSDIPEVKQTG
jgi:hypothetical protein